jgi:hypothetical protein
MRISALCQGCPFQRFSHKIDIDLRSGQDPPL